MSKVSTYLQGHLLGQVSTRKDIKELYSRDASGALTVMPEMVVSPQNVNDVRKIMRFVWQLAVKGHEVPVTPRGYAQDPTGASLSSGALLLMAKHMNQIFEYDSKQKLLRVQPGASADSVQSVLAMHGAAIPPLVDNLDSTIGGVVASDASSHLSAQYGTMQRWTRQLEVVLDTGDIIQTGRISKRSLNKLTGKQGREGDIYRGIDRILEDHAELIDSIRKSGGIDRSGYAGIIDVKDKNGSIDLTPLFVGSQGSLGIIVEMILGADFLSRSPKVAVIGYESAEEARDAADIIAKTKPTTLEYYDGRLLQNAISEGKNFEWISEKPEKIEAVLWVGYNNFSERNKKRAIKKLKKMVDKTDAKLSTSDSVDTDKLTSIQSLADYLVQPPSQSSKSGMLVLPGFYVPSEHFGTIQKEIEKIEKSLRTQLPISGSRARNIYNLYAPLSMQKVTDQQRLFKILDQLVGAIKKVGGSLVADGGEGRLLSRYARSGWSEEYEQMMNEIKELFDPHGILNPMVKSDIELKDLVSQLSKKS